MRFFVTEFEDRRMIFPRVVYWLEIAVITRGLVDREEGHRGLRIRCGDVV
jgi:hypothetical protein